MIRIQPAEGVWQRLGADLYPGVFPDGVTPVWGASGPESLTFTLLRPPQRVHADLAPFTPVEWYPGDDASGDPLWSGYTMQAPPGGYGESTSVTCVGWHYYRDDNPASKFWVHDDLTTWVDTRSLLDDVTLAEWGHGLIASVGEGIITLGAAQGQVWPTLKAVGVTLDLGPSNGAMRVTGAIRRGVGAPSNVAFYLRAHDAPAAGHMTTAVGVDTVSISPASGISDVGEGQSFVLTCTALRRYVTAFMYLSGATYTAGAEDIWQLLFLRVFADTTYDADYASTLHADRVIKDTRDTQCNQLSPDNSRITAVTFDIPHAAWCKQDATAREIQEAVNDYHGYRLGVDALKRVFFLPQPAVPRLQVDAAAPGVTYRPTSTNDGSEVYNHVSVRGQSGAGEELRIDRWLADVIDLGGPPSAVVEFINPSFDVDLTGWADLAARNTSAADGIGPQYLTAPGSGFANTSILGPPVVASMVSGRTALAGVPYQAFVYVRPPPHLYNDTIYPPNAGYMDVMRVRFGTSTDYVDKNFYFEDADFQTFIRTSIVWAPRANTPTANVKWSLLNQRALTYIDEASVKDVRFGPLGPRARKRSFTLNVGAKTDVVALESLAQAWLLAHRFVPHKASLTLVGADAVDLLTGAVVPADHLGRYHGEMIRVLSVPDPDTGALQSRDGIIASVQGADPVSLALDTERRSLEALMTRMGVIKG